MVARVTSLLTPLAEKTSLNFTSKAVALYFVDWDSEGRRRESDLTGVRVEELEGREGHS